MLLFFVLFCKSVFISTQMSMIASTMNARIVPPVLMGLILTLANVRLVLSENIVKQVSS